MKPIVAQIGIAGTIAAGALLILLVARTPASRAQSGPDLTAEIALIPAAPEPGQSSAVQIVVKNVGAASATRGFYIYLYVDPLDRPPTATTPDTYFWYLPGLPAGGSSSLQRSYTFTVTGCDHVIYVWVDRDNNVAENSEANNLVSQQVCVGVQCQPDAFEEDDACAAARWLASGETQARSLCPVGDEDWVKLTAVGGVTYTIQADNLGIHAEPRLYLYSSCSGLSQFGTGPRIDWAPPASGVYYVQVLHARDTYGPLATYDLSLAVAGSSGDLYEPDNTCATARDIPTDGTRQTHLFQAVGDEDWVRFSIDSGDSFTLVADNPGQGVAPLVSLYSSCSQAFSTQPGQSNQVQATAATGQVYYAKVVNQNSAVYGPQAHYDLRATVMPCAADAGEEDDTAAAARQVPTSGAAQTHNFCPRGDEDWVKFSADAGALYVLQTSNLGIASDTYLYLYGQDGATELARNDDYGYTLASRIIWRAPAAGVYYAKVRHHNASASGPDTYYDLAIGKGRCTLDAAEPDNSILEAEPLITDGRLQSHNFCLGADPPSDLADQDWVSFQAAAGATYLIRSSNLATNSDTVLQLYDRDGLSLLASNDDDGQGRGSSITFQAPALGAYFVQVVHYNSAFSGNDTAYQVSITGALAPTPTPTATPTATPTPTPTATPLPSQVKTLILTNRGRMSSLYGEAQTSALMSKLHQLADAPQVKGLVVQVEDNAAVAEAYDKWLASQSSLLDVSLANSVASAVRNLTLSLLSQHALVEYIVIVGSDQVIPFWREPEGNLCGSGIDALVNGQCKEEVYADDVTPNTPLWAALHNNMSLTDNYYADRQPEPWKENTTLYLPDYALGRLVEQPGEIIGEIDAYLSDDLLDVSRALVTGYDFVRDGGEDIARVLRNDLGANAVDGALIAASWTGDQLRDKQLNANPRFDLQSINGHSQHTAAGAPDHDDILASEVAGAASNLSGALIFSVGCHAGLNDSGVLDLAQAFAQKRATYVGNTGYGWGGSGSVYSEELMRRFARKLADGTSAVVGKALMAAKQDYRANPRLRGDMYDAKVLMVSTLYGLPMARVTSGGVLDPGDPFPSVAITSTPPTAFGPISVGRLNYGLDGSFGAFGETSSDDGTVLDLDDQTAFSAGSPVQPVFYRNLAAPQAGNLRGALFLGGVYTDVLGFDPVIAMPTNEYVSTEDEASFSADGWYPPVLFQVTPRDNVSTTAETLVTLLGQYDSASGTERLYDQMSFDTYYSSSPDAEPGTVSHQDGVLDAAQGRGLLKVEATDESGIIRVVVAYTDGQGVWQSRDLELDELTNTWTGVVSATVQTRYFVQIVDGAGNVAIDDDKGRYHLFLPPVPLVQGAMPGRLYLPTIKKGG